MVEVLSPKNYSVAHYGVVINHRVVCVGGLKGDMKSFLEEKIRIFLKGKGGAKFF